MKIGPKYKIARRLGAQVFEKTQGKKYALRESEANIAKGKKRSKPKTDFAIQMLEKQRVRFNYGITERQFSNYVKSVIAKKSATPEADIYTSLEKRLDTVVLRSGLASTRQMARQMVTHGHIHVNGNKTKSPSYQIEKGDIVSVRKESMDSPLFANLKEKTADLKIPSWITVDLEKKTVTVVSAPAYQPSELFYNLTTVLEFYRR
jgi:small subunit ribosomal protein S4